MDNKFGGVEGRRKGGLASQQRRRQNPSLYRALGCNMPKLVRIPIKSKYLSEIIGAILGDGGLTSCQLGITLNSEKDSKYSFYLEKQIQKIFNIEVKRHKRKNAKALCLKISGVNFIQILCDMGLFIGNKVKMQVDVPEWIKRDPEYSRWCLRGLMDTDGGIFLNKYRVNGKEYTYKKICFANMSKPLISFMENTLRQNGYHPSICGGNRVWLSSYKEVNKYIKEIGSSNFRLLNMIR